MFLIGRIVVVQISLATLADETGLSFVDCDLDDSLVDWTVYDSYFDSSHDL